MKQLLFPSLRGYNRKWLRADIMAALVVAAIAIPQSLGYAVIAGVPVQAGLYCALLAPIVFAMFTSSRRLIVGADSATAVLVAAGASSVAMAGTPEYGAAVAILGVLTAIILVVMAAARLGFLADLISQPVLIGFLAGVGVQLVVGKLPEMLGMQAHGDLLEVVGYVVTHLHEIHFPTVLLSAAVLGLIMIGMKVKWPGALLALLVSVVATAAFNLEAVGVAVVGAVPAGLPGLTLPPISFEMIGSLLVTAGSIAVVILTQSLAVIRSAAARHDEKVNDNKDLMSLGFANAASALTGGFAINGSPPRTSASEMAGGRSQLVNVFMAVIIALVLLFATGLFEYMPIAVLAVIVFHIGLHLIRFHELKEIYKLRKSEFLIAMIALGGVAILGVQNGIMIAVALALIERLRRQYRPHDEVLLIDQKFAAWANERLGIDKRQVDAPKGLVIYRFNDALFFENANYFLRRVTKIIESAKQPVRYFVLDAGAISDIDYTAVQALKQLYGQLDADDIQLSIAHVHPRLRALLKKYGLLDLIGDKNVHSGVRMAIEAYDKASVSNLDRIHALDLPTDEYVVISGTALELMGVRETHNVDMVVSKNVYSQLRAKNWKEYVQDDGKKVLSRYGYKVMTQWMGHTLSALRKSQHMIDGIPVMGVDDLIECKQRLGRKKDIEDIKLIKKLRKEGKLLT